MSAAAAVIAITLFSPSAPDAHSAVENGLTWLAQKQNKDGTWTNDGNFLTVNITSYAGLALLMEGSTLREGRFAPNLRRAVAWFEKIAQPNGLLVPADDPNEVGRSMQSHCAALLFLSSAYDADGDEDRRKRLKKLLDAAVKFAVDGQTARGGWGFVQAEEGGDNDEASSTVFMVQALHAAERAGVAVPPGATQKAARYLIDSTNRADGGLAYSPNYAAPGMVSQALPTAAGAAIFLSMDRRPNAVADWMRYTKQILPAPADARLRPDQINSSVFQQHLASARVAHALGETRHRTLDPQAREADLIRWSEHRGRLFRFLAANQNKDGSWADQIISPTYATSLALIMLQLDHDYLPAFSR